LIVHYNAAPRTAVTYFIRSGLYRTFLSPSYECPHGRRNGVSVPRRLVSDGDTFSLFTVSPPNGEKVHSVLYHTVPYGTVPILERERERERAKENSDMVDS